MLGADESGQRVQGVLSTAAASDDLRATVSAALVDGDPTTMRLLVAITQQVVGVTNEELALALLEQLRQVAEIAH